MTNNQVDSFVSDREKCREIARMEDVAVSARPRADERLTEFGLDRLDVLHAMQNCEFVTYEFAAWPCAVFHGKTLDGVSIAVAAVVSFQKIKIINLWTEELKG